MKIILMKWYLMAGVLFLALCGAGRAADDNASPSTNAELQKLEHRLNELANRQDRMMHRLAGPQGADGAMPWREWRDQETDDNGPIGRLRDSGKPFEVRIHNWGAWARAVFLGLFVCNILLAIWIFTDIRKRGDGPAIFIAIALIAGIPAAIIYSLVRIGDRVIAPVKAA